MKRHNVIILLCSALICLFAPVNADATNSTWNYAVNGTDWKKIGDCHTLTLPQAPLNVTNTDPTLNRSWLPYHWSFLPTFKEGNSTFNGFNNWVYMV